MILHHTKHHQAYVTNLNAALENHVSALSAADVKKQIELQQAMYVYPILPWTNKFFPKHFTDGYVLFFFFSFSLG